MTKEDRKLAAMEIKIKALYSALFDLRDIIPDGRILQTLCAQFESAEMVASKHTTGAKNAHDTQV